MTGYLFGYDLPKAIKDAKEVSRLSLSFKTTDKNHYSRDNYKDKNSYGQSSSGQNKRFFSELPLLLHAFML